MMATLAKRLAFSPFGGAHEQVVSRPPPERMLMPRMYLSEWREGSHASLLAALDSFVGDFTSVRWRW